MPVVDSKRLTVMKALCTLLEGITVAGGYQHTMTGKVSRGVPVLGANEDLPWINVLEFPKLDTEVQWTGGSTSGKQKYKHQWELVIQGWTATPTGADATMNPTDPTYRLLADVQKRLARIVDMGNGGAPGADYMLGGLVSNFDWSPGMVRPVDENSSTPCFYLRVRIEVAETTSDPYAS